MREKMKNIENEEVGQIYPSKSEQPGCFTRRKEKKRRKKSLKSLPRSSGRRTTCKTPLPHLNHLTPPPRFSEREPLETTFISSVLISPPLSLRQRSQTTHHLHHQQAPSAIHAALACLILAVHASPDRRVEIEEGRRYIIKLAAFLEGRKLQGYFQVQFRFRLSHSKLRVIFGLDFEQRLVFSSLMLNL